MQTVAIDSHALGTQFHCECSPQTLATWLSLPDYITALEEHGGPGFYRQLLAEAWPLMPEMTVMTRRLYDNFVEACGLRK